RLVGNFSNEKELFFMMGKFSPQLKELPGTVDMSTPATIEGRVPAAWIPPGSQPGMTPTPAHREENGDRLRVAQSLLEREIARTDLAPAEAEALREVLYALRERNVTRVGGIYRGAFAELKTQSEGVRQAFEQLDGYFGTR
ncbi:MAG TPA: hypothetical protein VNN25_21050, partial [Thermoanaerobaculia bacterium]|nr:hypothetical protein [Thermoanaerobaculia bacterium]